MWLATGLVISRLGARWSTLEGTITKPKVIPEEVGRSAGAGGAEWLEVRDD